MIDVSIRFADKGDALGDWIITPRGVADGFELKFRPPEVISEIMRRVGADGLRREALQMKEAFLTTITIFVEGRPIVLRYDPDEIPRGPDTVTH